MKILYVTFRFPPFHSAAAVLTGKVAKYLARRGHEVHVVTAGDQLTPPDLTLETDVASCDATRWFDVNAPAHLLLGGRQAIRRDGFDTGGRRGASSLSAVKKVWRWTINLPDPQVGWYPFAVRAGRRICREVDPDVIVSMCSPFTAHLVGARLAREFKRPWVAEYHDLFTNNHAVIQPAWRSRLDARWEARALARADAVVAYSPSKADHLRTTTRRPAFVIPSGFDPDDYAGIEPVVMSSNRLELVYTGTVYPAYQDFSPLLEALKSFDPDIIRLRFFGRYQAAVKRLVERLGAGPWVRFEGHVPFEESVRAQVEADVLVFVTWAGGPGQGVITTKAFEYMAARRPVLVVGGPDDAAKLLSHGSEPVCADGVDAVRAALHGLVETKRRRGRMPSVPASRSAAFTREGQAKAFESVLIAACHGNVDELDVDQGYWTWLGKPL